MADALKVELARLGGSMALNRAVKKFSLTHAQICDSGLHIYRGAVLSDVQRDGQLRQAQRDQQLRQVLARDVRVCHLMHLPRTARARLLADEGSERRHAYLLRRADQKVHDLFMRCRKNNRIHTKGVNARTQRPGKGKCGLYINSEMSDDSGLHYRSEDVSYIFDEDESRPKRRRPRSDRREPMRFDPFADLKQRYQQDVCTARDMKGLSEDARAAFRCYLSDSLSLGSGPRRPCRDDDGDVDDNDDEAWNQSLDLSLASFGGEAHDLHIRKDATLHALFACAQRIFKHPARRLISPDGRVFNNFPGFFRMAPCYPKMGINSPLARTGDIVDANFATVDEAGFQNGDLLTCELRLPARMGLVSGGASVMNETGRVHGTLLSLEDLVEYRKS